MRVTGIFAVPFILAFLALVFGWFANIYQLVGMVDGPITALFILKAIGIFFAPVGGAMGLIGLF
jgi:succinate dehydrogenase hydrophobic anchor subunit